MAIRYRNVVGILTNAVGAPLVDAQLKFTLSRGYGLTATHLITDAVVFAVTKVDGSFSIPLWCDEDSLRAIDYKVNLPRETAGEPLASSAYEGVFSLLYGDGAPIELAILLVASIPNPTTTDLLYQLVDARIAVFDPGALFSNFTVPASLAEAERTILTGDEDQDELIQLLKTILKRGGASEV